MRSTNGRGSGLNIQSPRPPISPPYANARFAATGSTFTLGSTGALYSVAASAIVGYYPATAVRGTVFAPVAGRPGGLPLMLQLGCGPSCPSYASGSTGKILLRNNGAYNVFGYCNGILEVLVDGTTCVGTGDVEELIYVIV
jgi:hypothetical protein